MTFLHITLADLLVKGREPRDKKTVKLFSTSDILQKLTLLQTSFRN